MAHKKGVGSSDNGRDSHSKRLGVKLFGGSYAIPGNIIIRQRGTKFHPGLNVGIGRDHTLYAKAEGFVTFTKKKKNRTYVSIEPAHVVTDEVVTGTVASRSLKGDEVEAGEAITEDQVVELDKKHEEVDEKPVQEDNKVEETQASEEETVEPDDLTRIEGIGPKTSEAFINAGMSTFSKLSQASYDELKEILTDAGSRLAHLNPTTWPKQAQMIVDDKLDELQVYQDKMKGGIELAGSEEE